MPNRILSARFLSALVVLSLVFLGFHPASAQAGITLALDSEVDTANFPQLVLYTSVFDEQGYVVSDATTENFTALEDGNPVKSLQVEPVFEQPLAIALVVDASASMTYGDRPTPMENVINIAKGFVSSLAPEDQVAVVSFADKVAIAQELTPDKTQAQIALETITTGQNAALNEAILTAVDLLKVDAKRPVIVLITDSADSGRTPISRVIDAAVQQSIVVYTISWGGARQEELQDLSELTKGAFLPLVGPYPEGRSFQTAFNNIQNDLSKRRLQYKLVCTSALRSDGQPHELSIQLDYLGRSAEAKASFTTPVSSLEIELPDLLPGQAVGGNVLFAPRFQPPDFVQKLEIQIDGQSLTTIVNPPFEYTWNSTNVPPGEHRFTLTAQDSLGNTSQKEISLQVQEPVSVTITAPKNGVTLTQATIVQAQVQALSKVSRVEFQLDGRTMASLTEPPYQFTWNVLASSDEGVHEWVVTAYDINGFKGEDRIKVSTGSPGSDWGGLGILLAIILGAAVLAIPISQRMRRRMKRSREAVAGPVASVSLGVPTASQAALFETQGLNPGQSWSLPVNAEIRLGRKREDNDIPLMGQSASRMHALVRFQGGSYVVYSLKPENPVLVNGQPVPQQHTLRPGDVLQAGDSFFEFQVRA
ncbi:MAG: Ig-like domain-containing protein [Chloroflexota bacterium]